MAETDVEIILREIRERVLAEQQAGKAPASAAANGNSNESRPASLERHDDTATSEKLALINSYLVTLARAWDRLPPLVSNRSGTSARIELWLKRHLKRATRWYAWEQVNFNASVHQSIRDILQVLIAYQQELEQLRANGAAQETAQAERQAVQLEQQAELERHQAERNRLRSELETQQRTIETLQATIAAYQVETGKNLTKVLSELRDRISAVQEEQRVAFKQISLETSEAAVLEDRARRKTEAALEELRKKIN